MFGGRGATCKHIKRVLRRGCLAVRDERAAGPNDLAAVGVEITDAARPLPRATQPTKRRCACGEMMLAPRLRMDDGAGHQIVQVQFGGGGAEYAYAWGGKRVLAVGDPITAPRSASGGPWWPWEATTRAC
jgi:hypothetical protein